MTKDTNKNTTTTATTDSPTEVMPRTPYPPGKEDKDKRRLIVTVTLSTGRTIDIYSLTAMDVLPVLTGERFQSITHMMLYFMACMTGLEIDDLTSLEGKDIARLLIHVKAETHDIEKALAESNLLAEASTASNN